MKHLRCCICNTNKYSKAYKKVNGFDLKKCRKCSLIYLNEIHVESNKFIDDTKKGIVEYWSFPKLYSKHQGVFEYFFKQRLTRLLSFDIPSGPVLDVGIGYGFWANFLHERKYQVHGIDISKEAVEYSNKNFPFASDLISFESYSTEKKFSAIFMFDVLEHFEQPELMLKKAHSMLLPGGVIYIQVPNVIGIRFPYGHNLGLPHHLWQFNPRTLKKLMRKSGFNSKQHLWTGIQGVIQAYEKGGPKTLTKILWLIANLFKIGNRAQVLSQKCNSSPQSKFRNTSIT